MNFDDVAKAGVSEISKYGKRETKRKKRRGK